MSHLNYYAYDGVGKENLKTYGYNQAVRVGDRIELAGQDFKLILIGGWDPKTGQISKDVNEQIDQAFKNVDLALKDAGGKGWSQVYRVNTYHIPLDDEAMAAVIRNFKQWMPDHSPIWTCVGVFRLGIEEMRVEVEVVAHAPEAK